MEPTNQNTQEPIISETEMKMPEGHTSNAPAESDRTAQLGVILGILIVILVLILGGLYLWGAANQNAVHSPAPVVIERPTPEDNNEPESTTADAQIQTLETVSTSDELSAIEADIDSTNLDEIDAELEAIDAELDAALSGL